MTEQVVIKIPGGEAALGKALRAYFAQKRLYEKYSTFQTVLHALYIYITENKIDEYEDWITKLTNRYLDLLAEYDYYNHINARASIIFASEMNKIILEVFSSKIIPPRVLAEAVAVEESEKIEEIPKGVMT